jgi:hypothetical protein
MIGTKEYEPIRYQYATSSYVTEGRMNPRLIIKALTKEDISLVLKYAKSQKIAVAIRTGGHQYSGASSTIAPNIQLDLKNTFRSPDDQRIFEDGGKTFIRTSVSWSLGQFNEFLQANNVFVPHGQCINVHLGGHVQTGGHGQLMRSFGLFGDHVISLEIVDHEGNFKEVTKTNDPELFYAFIGGSPGNLGVITHFTIMVHRDSDYKGSRGVKSLYFYNTKTLKRLLDILAKMADDENFPPNYDLTINVLSSTVKLLDFVPEMDDLMRKNHPEIYGEDGMPFYPRVIVVYAQWVPFKTTDTPDMAWFNRILEGSLFNLPVKVKPMSELTGDWLFRNVREFDHPYIKRTHYTNSRTLTKDGWPAWLTGRIDAIVAPNHNRCWLASQIQCIGGKMSKFSSNADGSTSYSWRDSTVAITLDCFFEPSGKKTAEEWHKINDAEGIGRNGKFCKTSRRVLWGSWGNFDLDASWSYYYDDRAKYERLRKTRQRVDPDGVFTPNAFCVKR